MQKEPEQFRRALEYQFSPDRICSCCKKQLTGRSDKRFCDYKCKNKYHSGMRTYRNQVNREINSLLDRNYQGLMELMGPNKQGIFTRAQLHRKNFDFARCTGYKLNQFGAMNYVYNYYWFERPGNRIEVRFDPKAPPLPEMVLRRWQADLRAKGII